MPLIPASPSQAGEATRRAPIAINTRRGPRVTINEQTRLPTYLPTYDWSPANVDDRCFKNGGANETTILTAGCGVMRDPLHIERSSSTTRHTPPQHHHHHHHQGPVRPHERRHAETGGSATTPPRATTTHSPARSIINHIDAPAAPAAPPTDISLGRAPPPQHRIARPADHPPSCSRRHRPRIYRPFRAVHLCTQRMTHVNNFFLPTQ
ncbi:uncharacterized protein LOC143914530 [Arctopsyche grandis]|uniref:uncharacterized protein LOC143914530 n=1 Tax=Arctopsyche grandis TaxID=121162 RepID=UPI00406D9D8A